MLIKDVAESLCIHSFMLSRWRKQVRDGELTGDPPALEPQETAELQTLRDVERQFKRLQMEHELLKKCYPICLRTKDEVFTFIEANRQAFPVQMMCRVHDGEMRR